MKEINRMWNGFILVGTNDEIISSNEHDNKYFSNKEELLEWMNSIENSSSMPPQTINNHGTISAADLLQLLDQAEEEELNTALCEYPHSVNEYEALIERIRSSKSLFIVGFFNWDPPVAVW